MRFSASIVSLALAAGTANAFSTGAGGCAPGQAAVGGGHVATPNFVTGTLESAGISVTFDGDTAADGGVLSADGTDVEVSSADGFRGVLIMSTDPAVGIVSVDGVQPAGACAAVGAIGVTHFDPSVKESVEAVVDCQAPDGSQVLVGVTVVVSNNQNDGSEFYYSEYLMTCGEASTEVPTTIAPVGPDTTVPEDTAVPDSTLVPTDGDDTAVPDGTVPPTEPVTPDGTPFATGADIESTLVPTGNVTDSFPGLPTLGPEGVSENVTIAPTEEDTMMGNETAMPFEDGEEVVDADPTLPTLPTLSPGIAEANAPSAAFSSNNAMLDLGATAFAAAVAAAAMFA
jgi:hypothetical protein